MAVLMRMLINRRQSPAPPSKTEHTALMGEAGMEWEEVSFSPGMTTRGCTHMELYHSPFNVINLLSLTCVHQFCCMAEAEEVKMEVELQAAVWS